LSRCAKKNERKDQEKMQKKNLGDTLEVDAQKYNQIEAHRGDAHKQRCLEHRSELERQIALKMRSPGKKDTMSACELAMNRKLLARVERDTQED